MKDGYKGEDTFSVDRRDHIFIRTIGGYIEQKILWMQFKVYCADSKEPFYVTPQLTAKDFVKEGDRDYYYYVDEVK